MVKKRVRDQEVLPEAPVETAGSDGSGSDEDVDMVNVEFEWFNLKPDVDFHGIKNLLRQSFDVDHNEVNLSALTDLILSQPTIGSTVKVDGEQEDPYAFLTVLNLQEHREKEGVNGLIKYLIERCETSPSLAEVLPSLLTSTNAQVGLILSERLINVPSEIGPPMYRMISDEVESAVDDKEPYEFTHYLILSKTYAQVESALDREDAPRQKKSKAAKTNKEIFYFHAEDEVVQKHALAYGSFAYKDENDLRADSKRAFQEMGIMTQGHLILLDAKKFEDAVVELTGHVQS